MDAQQQGQAYFASQGKKKRFSRRTIVLTSIIIGIVIATVLSLSSLNVIPGYVAVIITSFGLVFGVIFALLAIIPTDEKNATLVTSSTAPPALPSTSSDKPTQRGIAGFPPPTDPRTIQQREQAVQDIYARLTQPGTSAVVLTGIGGQGKSTLAALVYRYAETQQRTGHGYFTAAPLWLRVDPAVTLGDMLTNVCDALQVRTPDIASLSPENQAFALFNVLNRVDKPLLVVLDQFENVLDDEGRARADRPGIGELLDAFNSNACACRVLLTSRPDPQGTRDYPSTGLLIYPVEGLSEAEGIELLRKWNVDATEADMRTAVKRCNGHALSLTLLASLLQKRHLSLATLLSDPQLWKGNLAKKLLDDIYQELSDPQSKLLAAFSVYREPVPVEAALAVASDAAITRNQADEAIDTLLAQHLLDAKGEGSYLPHAIVAEYARDHLVAGDEQANRQVLLSAHARAAQYYLERAKMTCPPRDQRRKVSDVEDLIEAIWQYCLAEQWQDAYELMEEEVTFEDVNRWGGNTLLLEIYQLLETGKQQLEPKQQARVTYNLGLIYQQLGHTGSAINYYQRTLLFNREVGNRGNEGAILNNLGGVYDDLGQKQQALRYYEQALTIYREVGNRGGEGTTLNNLGEVYRTLGQQQEALRYYEQALTIRREVGDRGGEGAILNNLGLVYKALGQQQEALRYFEQALTILREVGDRSGEGTTLWNIGALYYTNTRYDVALACFLLARGIFEEVQSPNRDKVHEEWIDDLRNKVGEEQYSALLAQVEPRAQEIVDEALRDGGML